MAELNVNVEEDANGSAQLRLTNPSADERTRAVFAKYGWAGNGYDWGGVGQALALMKMPGGATNSSLTQRATTFSSWGRVVP
jgi:hypothetical protein